MGGQPALTVQRVNQIPTEIIVTVKGTRGCNTQNKKTYRRGVNLWGRLEGQQGTIKKLRGIQLDTTVNLKHAKTARQSWGTRGIKV